MAYSNKYDSTESLEHEDSPTLSTHSLPGHSERRRSGYYLRFSDEDSLGSSCEHLNEPQSLHQNGWKSPISDSHSMSELSPYRAPGGSPQLPRTSNWGKKRRAPLPPVHVSSKEPGYTKRRMSQDDFFIDRRLSIIDEDFEKRRRQTSSEDFEKRRRPVSSFEVPSINITEVSPRLSSSQRFKMKAALILSIHSPKHPRKDESKKKMHIGGKSFKKKSANTSFEEVPLEDISFCFVANDLHEDSEFEVQRIPEYDKYLNDLLEETDSSHPDYEELSRATSRVKNMIKEHEDELGTSENKTKMDSIQLRFPNDNLQLDDGKEQKRTSSTRRRKSAPGAVLFKTLGKSKSSSNLWSSVTMGKKEMDLASPISRNQTQDNRQFVMEGQVEFATGVQIQDRYMFLFNDLLLVAKQKTSTTFKLKHRVRVCEIWISEWVTDVTELTRSTELSFVMGWPLCNFVATFKTLDLKQQWLAKLTEQIENERQKEQPKVIKLKVVSREISEPCTVEVDPNMDALTVLRKCMDQTHLSDSDIKDYQMWARYGKEDSPYPLIGHELPYSIKMSQLRDSYQSKNGDVSLPSNEEMLDDHHNSNVEFILKHRKSSKKQNLDDTGKSMKKPKRSPFNIFRRGKDDKNNNSSPVGKLFGRPLEDVTEEGLPKAVMDLFRIMYRDGPYTKGILRKSANSVKCKEIHDKLDEGEDCLDDNIQTLVVGAVLKDYLRSLPHCLLLEENYNEWVALSEQDDSSAKMNKVKQLLYKIPPRNFDLLRHLMCVLHHIQEKHTENMMTSYNLAVCITPSILWSKEQIKDPMATQSPHKAIMYLIDNCAPIFGPETLNLFSDLNEQKNRQDSSTDSDSMHSYLSAQDSGSGMRPDNSSIDSLERDLYSEFDSSPNLMKSHLSPSNLSRDSGLTLSDAQLYDSNENLAERKNYSRSVSQYMDRDSDKSKYIDNVSRSYDNSFDIQNPKPPPRKNKKREFSNEQENVTKSVRNTMTPSYSAEGFLDYKGNSTESLRSLEDTCAESDVHHEFLRHPDFGTLIKSSSGAHLYYDETKQETTKNQRFVSEMEIQTRPPVGGNGRLMRQASVTDSNPPTSPHSRLSCGSSIDSGIPHSSSCSSFMHGQSSHESDSHFSIWSTSEDRFHASQDDASLNNQYSSARKSSNSKKTVNYLVSPPISPKTSRKVFNSDLQHKGLSMRRSFPMDDPSHTKGSGSDSYKEAEDIIRPRFQLSTFDSSGKDQDYTSPILSSRYGSSASASDVRTNMPMKAINKYGLGTSPPPGVILKLHQNKQRRDITPMRASHDSSILSQVRRNSTDSSGSDPRQTTTEHHHSELIVGRLNTPPYPLRRSDSDGEINRSLSSSPSRPDRPPSYDEACQRTFMIKHGIPLEISEQDSEKQKEASLRAKQLYEESLRKYMEEHLNSPSVSDRTTVSRKEEVIMEQEEGESDNTESSEEEIEYRKNDPKKIYEESMKVYEQMSKNTSGPFDKTPAIKNAQTNHHLSPNLHRSCSDSSEHLNKVGNWSRRSPTRDKSPLASDRKSVEISRKSSSTQLNYSSSSVSNSSSETVTENQQIPPYRRDRSESSPVTSRHYFPKTSDNFAQNIGAQSQQKSSKEFFGSRDSSVESKYSVRTRDAPPSQDWRNSYSQEQKKTTTIQDPSKPRFFTGARASSLEGQDRTGNRDTSAKTNINKFESKSSITWKSKAKHESALSWSVKNLRSVYDQSNSDRSSSPSGSQTNELRPPPPPYQPPPPFRRDNARMSSSSNSSCSSSNTDHSANIPQTKNSLSHRRLGGPQARDSFSDDSDTSSRSSGHLKNSSNSSSDHETWTYLDTEVTFV